MWSWLKRRCANAKGQAFGKVRNHKLVIFEHCTSTHFLLQTRTHLLTFANVRIRFEDMNTPRPWIELQVFLHRDGMTQAQMARKIGISPSYLNELIRGRRTPNGRIINLAARALKVPFSMLIPSDDEELSA